MLGDDRQILLVWLPGEKAGLVSVWHDGGASISLWRSVFVRHAWEQIEPIEAFIGKAMGQGKTIAEPSDELLGLVAAAYESASANTSQWDGLSYYVIFGEARAPRLGDAANTASSRLAEGPGIQRRCGSSAGNRVFAYIPKGNGVGGYVGLGGVTGPAVLAKDFMSSTRDGAAHHRGRTRRHGSRRHDRSRHGRVGRAVSLDHGRAARSSDQGL